MMKIEILILLLIFVLSIYSCKEKHNYKTIDTNTVMGYDYAGIDVGKSVTYNGMRIDYDTQVDIQDTTCFLLKQTVESTFIDNSGETAYRIVREIKYQNDSLPYDSIPWQIKDIWYASLKNNSYELVEENQRFIKLKFPLDIESEWDGNKYNTNEPWFYFYNQIDTDTTINSLYFPETLSVIQRNNINLVEEEYAIEIFAKNIGMIYKRYKDIDIEYPNIENIKGIDIELKVIDYD